MLDPKIVATSTQRSAGLEQGAAAGRERMSGSSHGGRMKVDKLAVR
jgi:hypothetical protein